MSRKVRQPEDATHYVGKTYQMLTVLAVHERVPGKWRLRCRCECGNETVCDAGNLGHIKSCGCLRHSMNGASKLPLYNVYKTMIHRCHDPKTECFHRYGGRGIKVCDRWRNSFEAFLADMGERPDGSELDRINNDGNYEPGNVRWTTRKMNTRNRRTSRFLTHDGRTATVAEWSEIVGIKQTILHTRLSRGWTAERTLTTPLRVW